MIHAAAALLLSWLNCVGEPEAPAADLMVAAATRPILVEAAPLLGGDRPLKASGLAPAKRCAPWVLIASASDAPPDRYRQWTEALAHCGFATLVVERQQDEAWWRYAKAIEDAATLLRAGAATPDHPLFEAIDPHRLLVLADGDGTTAAARAAATIVDLDGLLLLDPNDAGAALPWLARIEAPVATVASGFEREEHANTWFRAGRGGTSRRWLVQFQGEQGLPPDHGKERPRLEQEVRDVCVAFVECTLPTATATATSTRTLTFAERAGRGTIDRTIKSTDDAARIALAQSR
ncbi:MAG: hypothetical protein EXR73_01055 [Myxococcales bacterium]|nr:hypothetical protein [Myxococcales bacterium]